MFNQQVHKIMHLRFSFNSNNLNAQVNSNELHKLKKKDYASVLPVVLSIESVDFGSSESEFGTSVNSTMLAWALEISPSGSWMSSYVPSASGVASI